MAEAHDTGITSPHIYTVGDRHRAVMPGPIGCIVGIFNKPQNDPWTEGSVRRDDGCLATHGLPAVVSHLPAVVINQNAPGAPAAGTPGPTHLAALPVGLLSSRLKKSVF